MRPDRHVVMGAGGAAIVGPDTVALVDAHPGTERVAACEAALLESRSAVDAAAALVEIGDAAPMSFAIAAVDAGSVTTVIVRGDASATVGGGETIRHRDDTSAWALVEVGEHHDLVLALPGDDTPTGQWLTTGVIAAGAIAVGRLRPSGRRTSTPTSSPTDPAIDFGSLVGQPPPTVVLERIDDERDRKASTAPYVPSTPTDAVGHLVTDTGERIALDVPIVVGRQPATDVVAGVPPRVLAVDDTLLSRHHATLWVLDDRLVVVDAGSTNGTVVTAPGAEPITCERDRPIDVPVGATVDFGGALVATHHPGPPSC